MKRYIEKGQVCFVTSVTKNRARILKAPDSADLFLATLQYFSYYLGFELYGYVVMPDHFHLLFRPSDAFDVSQVMRYIKGNFARRYNQIHHIGTEHVWQRRYWESVIRDEKDFRARLEYIHYNPVKAGLVSRQADYPFSSYNQYFSKARSHVQARIVRAEL